MKKSKPKKLVAYAVVCGNGRTRHCGQEALMYVEKSSAERWIREFDRYMFQDCGPHQIVKLVEERSGK